MSGFESTILASLDEVHAQRMARQQDIELIDGEDLWPEVRPYVARPAHDTAAAPAPVESPQPTSPKTLGIAWAGAAVVAAVAWMIAQGLQPEAPAASDAANIACAD